MHGGAGEIGIDLDRRGRGASRSVGFVFEVVRNVGVLVGVCITLGGGRVSVPTYLKVDANKCGGWWGRAVAYSRLEVRPY
jgi:hypothetical protein